MKEEIPLYLFPFDLLRNTKYFQSYGLKKMITEKILQKLHWDSQYNFPDISGSWSATSINFEINIEVGCRLLNIRGFYKAKPITLIFIGPRKRLQKKPKNY